MTKGNNMLIDRRTFLAAAGSCAAMVSHGNTSAAQEARPPMKVLLWCWDSRMTWDDEPDRIQLNMAASDTNFSYPKRPESFEIGFRRLIDYCEKNGIWGIVIWGFLREAHGGVQVARDLCKYAKDKGVAIIPGVGLCSYGGYYYEGEHMFNLDMYLKTYPERASRANEERGGREVRQVLDPSLPLNQQWWRDGLEWMLENFEIAGINYEMGDFIVNPSEGARAARSTLGVDTDENILDIIVATQALMDRAYQLMPEGAFINALYRGYHQIKNIQDLAYVKCMHPKTVWEYTLTGMVREKDFDAASQALPEHRQYGYLHWFNASTKTMDKDYTADIARVFPVAYALGFEFIGTYGELSGSTAVADRNYCAQVTWSRPL